MDGPLTISALIATILAVIFAVAAFIVQRKRREAALEAERRGLTEPFAVHQVTSKLEELISCEFIWRI